MTMPSIYYFAIRRLSTFRHAGSSELLYDNTVDVLLCHQVQEMAYPLRRATFHQPTAGPATLMTGSDSAVSSRSSTSRGRTDETWEEMKKLLDDSAVDIYPGRFMTAIPLRVITYVCYRWRLHLFYPSCGR